MLKFEFDFGKFDAEIGVIFSIIFIYFSLILKTTKKKILNENNKMFSWKIDKK